jgi:hypothetical protein
VGDQRRVQGSRSHCARRMHAGSKESLTSKKRSSSAVEACDSAMASVHGTAERAPRSAGGGGACQTRLSRHRLRANYPRRRALTWQAACSPHPSTAQTTHYVQSSQSFFFCPCALLCHAADSGLLPCRTQAHAKPSRKLTTSTKSMYTIYESVAASSKIDIKRKGKRKRWSLQETQHRVRHLPTMTRLTPFQPPRIFPTLPTPSTYFIKNALAASPMARPELHLA